MSSARGSAATAYTKTMGEEAGALGFQFGGDYKVEKKALKASATLWLSPSLETLAVVSETKTAGLSNKRTQLLSCLNNGKILATTDSFELPEPSGLTETQMLLHAHFPELDELHRRALVGREAELRRFDATKPLQGFEAILQSRAEASCADSSKEN